MDKLSSDAMLARKAGMTYGKWKALQPVVKFERKIPKDWKVCEFCGKAFMPNQKNQRFCDIGCRTDAYKPKAKAQYADYYHSVRKERLKKEKEGKEE